MYVTFDTLLGFKVDNIGTQTTLKRPHAYISYILFYACNAQHFLALLTQKSIQPIKIYLKISKKFPLQTTVRCFAECVRLTFGKRFQFLTTVKIKKFLLYLPHNNQYFFSIFFPQRWCQTTIMLHTR